MSSLWEDMSYEKAEAGDMAIRETMNAMWRRRYYGSGWKMPYDSSHASLHCVTACVTDTSATQRAKEHVTSGPIGTQGISGLGNSRNALGTSRNALGNSRNALGNSAELPKATPKCLGNSRNA